jgi:TPR repeat protein
VWKWVDNKPENWRDRLPDYQCMGSPVPPAPLNNYAAAGSYSSTSYGASDTSSSASASPSDPNAALTTVPPAAAQSVLSSPGSTTVSGSAPDSISTVTAGAAPTDSSYAGSSYNSASTSGSYGASSSYSSNYSSYGGYGSGYYGGRGMSSVFVANSSEALTYFLIAQNLGHPLAAAYVANERAALKYNTDAARLIADAEKRARFWTAPYEYYPGITAKGELHSDESLPSVEARLALRRVREIPLSSIVEALDFRGYRMLPRLCGPPPVCLNRATTQFQTANNWEPTGYLSPVQTVRLIQMAAVDGDAIAQDRLGIMYAKGIGVEQNFVRAEKWFIKAANQRYPDALFNLSVLYRVGPNGVDQDQPKSDSYRAQAERAGYAMARCELLDLLKLADSAGHERPEGGSRK